MFELFNMEITSSRKDKLVIPIQPIIDLTFLKRGFRKDGLFIKPTLDHISLVSMISFVRVSSYSTLSDQLDVNLDVYLSFAYFYGPEYYAKIGTLIKSVLPTKLLPTYVYYDNKFLYGEFNLF